MVLHYGNDLTVNDTGYSFSKIKIREARFDAMLCPPWELSDNSVTAGGLLPYPPSPLSSSAKARLPKLLSQRNHNACSCYGKDAYPR
jgi:hypothetical protein